MRRALKSTLLAAAAVIASPALSQARAAPAASQLSLPPIAYKMRKLANGLTVYSLRDTTTPNVQMSVWYDVGSKHDPDGRSGFAHLFAG